jgi:hypothetical protein
MNKNSKLDFMLPVVNLWTSRVVSLTCTFRTLFSGLYFGFWLLCYTCRCVLRCIQGFAVKTQRRQNNSYVVSFLIGTVINRIKEVLEEQAEARNGWLFG